MFVRHPAFGLPFTAIRISNSYGERQAKYVIHDFLAKLLSDPSRLEVLGDGNQRRDFCHVSDVSRCFLLAAESDATRGEVLNLAGSGSISIAELAHLVVERLGLDGITEVRYTSKSWQGDISLLLPDIAKVRRLLGFSPQVTLNDGLGALIQWLEARKGWELSALRPR